MVEETLGAKPELELIMFLERAKIGYVCWLCSADTLEFHSDSDMELCEACDAAYEYDFRRKASELIRENELHRQDSDDDLIPRVDLKIKMVSFQGLFEFMSRLNDHVGKDKWMIMVNPIKEMANNGGKTTSHFQLFVDYKDVKKNFTSVYNQDVSLSSMSYLEKEGEDYRYTDADYEKRDKSYVPYVPMTLDSPHIIDLCHSDLPDSLQLLTSNEIESVRNMMNLKYRPRTVQPVGTPFLPTRKRRAQMWRMLNNYHPLSAFPNPGCDFLPEGHEYELP